MNRTSWRQTLMRLAIAAMVVLGASRAMAANVSIEMGVVGSYDPYVVEYPLLNPAPDGSFTLASVGGGTTYICDWSLVVDPDPSITGNFNITNLSSFAQTFILTVTLPVSLALVAPTRMGGYVGDILYSDSNGNGNQAQSGNVQLMTVGSNPFYRALIDGAGVQDLGLFDTGDICCGAGIGGTVSLLDFGTPIPSAPGPALNTNIAIRLQFNVTAGDKVSFPAHFRVEAPEPASVLLIGLFAAGLVAARVRRS